MRGMATGFSFESVSATDYDELRPGYAAAAVDRFAERARLDATSLVVDLAAGTGQLSRRLRALGPRVVAVEPAANMRAVLADGLRDVTVLDGTAEAIPLADGEADAVVVGNAFHHFDAERAFAEIRRVLRPGGSLALFWAWPAEDTGAHPALPRIEALVEEMRGTSPIAQVYRRWSEIPATVPGFSPFERDEFAMTKLEPSERLADLWATSSDVASMPGPARSELLDRIRALSRALPPTVDLAFRTVVDRCVRQEP